MMALTSIGLRECEVCYRIRNCGEWIEEKEFCALLFEMDNVTLEHYKSQKPKN